jgi:perosamine synthetase
MSIHLFKPVVSEAAISAVSEVLRSGWTGLGPKTKQFERDFADYVGAKYCVGVNSCTSALHLALHVLNLSEGDEVISTPLTFVSTNHAILYEKATPIFADVEEEYPNIDPDDVERKITPRTKAIIIVHYGGQPCRLERFQEISHTYNIPIIEDCAHAAGASWCGQKIGSISSLNCFSFHSVKNLSIGDGGAVTTNNPLYDERLRRLCWLGIDKSTYNRTSLVMSDKIPKAYAWQYSVPEKGFKYHMNDIMAAIGIEQLKLLDGENKRRAEIVQMYTEELTGVKGVQLLEQRDDVVSSNHIFAIVVEDREKLINKLKAYDIHPGVHYLLNTRYPMYKEVPLPNAEKFERTLLSLPLHLALTDEDVQRVIDVIKKGW